MAKYGRSHHKKRTQEEYEKEAEDAAKRFKKYKERLKYAGDSEEWKDFLDSIGVYHRAITGGGDFWENVRNKVLAQSGDTQAAISKFGVFTVGFAERQFAQANAAVVTRKAKDVDNPKTIRYRDVSSGKFISKKEIQRRLNNGS